MVQLDYTNMNFHTSISTIKKISVEGFDLRGVLEGFLVPLQILVAIQDREKA